MAIFHLYIYSDSLSQFLIHKLDNLFAYIWASKSCDYCTYYTLLLVILTFLLPKFAL